MKIIALLLSLYIFLLAGAPAWGEVGLFPQANCCLDICTDKQEEHAEEEEDGCDDVCNPFQSCSCCLGFTMQPLDPVKAWVPDSYATQNDRIHAYLSLQLIFPVWHPPRV
jgi:hypothetical protein